MTALLFGWVADRLLPHVSLTREELLAAMELPPKPEMGDAAFPCYPLSRVLKRPPAMIATELAAAVNGMHADVRAESAGPYVNLFFTREQWVGELLDRILDPGFARSTDGSGKRVVIDLSSPNIAKPFGVGHLRSTMIGNALANLYRSCGYDVVKVNHIGDWGTQFGKLMTAYTRWGDEAKLKEEPIRESLRLYVRFHEEAEKDAALEDEARRWFWKLEKGEADAQELWRYFVSFSLEEFERVYSRLGVTFDYTLGESFYNDKMDAVVQELQRLELLEESDGAHVVRLDEEGMPPCLILKSDGTTIYPTRDLATAIYRKQVMGADQLLYVVGKEQQLHFKQVFAVLKHMEHEWSEQCEHVAFGLMKFEGRKMSTRKGQVVFLDEVLDEAVAKAEAIIEEKNADIANKREVAEAVGIGAIIFGDLKHTRMLEADFSLEEALRFEGETGPYLQYTAARINKLLNTGGFGGGAALPSTRDAGMYVSQASAWECLKTLAAYPDAVQSALRSREPAVISRYLLDVAKSFNRFYHQERILTESGPETSAKLLAAAAVHKVLCTGLELLGMQVPEQI
ncbi:arginine--tRNA ligase [Paenibacillus mendelii]|uniref:Arginine--tRNA ligase n=1 Tax=Paenibacillus mendelii TaxID=206163 RepID=A0ABV6JKN7_9BACL|nr:arginine--tRNA ligase [Paenibacillus mendelii]MCQ6563953.1 arginine--tRNA ligase [Paenibacillus mendelii]